MVYTDCDRITRILFVFAKDYLVAAENLFTLLIDARQQQKQQ